MEEKELSNGIATETEVVSLTKKGRALRQCQKIGVEILVYFGVFLLTTVLFLTVKPLIQVQRKGVVAQSIMAVSIAACLAFIAYMGMAKRLTTRNLLIVFLLLGFILRVGYMLYTPAGTRQHDSYGKNFDGHDAYAWTIFGTGKLPTTNEYQFYHPPLNAMVQAAFMKWTSSLAELFSWNEAFFAKFAYGMPKCFTQTIMVDGTEVAYMDLYASYFPAGATKEEVYFLYSTNQILSVMYSVVTVVTMVKLLSLFTFSNKTKLLIAAIVIFYPRNMQFAGLLNNDGISYMLGILALYYALRWWKGGRKLVWILLCGLAVGLGMMAKLSSATICLPIAGIFIYEFVITLRKKTGSMKLWEMAVQYGLFLCICAPIGLWFQVHAKEAFGQDFGHVFSNLNTRLSTAHKSLFSRFILPTDISELFGNIYCVPFSKIEEGKYVVQGNYWLFNYALRSSIFGEFSYWQGEGFAITAIVFGYIAAILLFIVLVWCFVLSLRGRKKENRLLAKSPVSYKDFLFVFLLVQSQVLSEIYFYLQMPYACTMDFRYIMPLVLGIALTVGCARNVLLGDGSKTSVALNRALSLAIVGFLASSALFYCVCI